MDVRVVSEKTLLRCPVKVSAVVDGGLLGWRTTEDLWLPGIKMGVEVNDADRPIGLVDASE